MKTKFLAIAGAMLVASVALTGCSGSDEPAPEGSAVSVQSTLESAVSEAEPSAVSDPDAWMEKNEKMEIARTALTQGNITINYPVLQGMDTAEKQEKLNACLAADANSCLANNFAGAGGDMMGTMDFTIAHQTRQFLSFFSTGTFIKDGEEQPRLIYSVTNLDLQTGERTSTPVRENAATYANIIRSGNGYSVLAEKEETITQQKQYLMGLSEADLTAILSKCDYTEEDHTPKCFSYYVDQDNLAIYIPVTASPHSPNDFAVVKIHL